MQTVLITGAGRGIGLATTKKFLESGYIVVACSRNLSALNELMQTFGDACKPIYLDLNSEESMEELGNFLKSKKLEIDYFIHNAGHLVNKPFADINIEELQTVYRVNVLGPFRLTQLLIDSFSHNMHMVAISSMGGIQGSVKFPGLSAYSSSKAAIASLMECLQAEYAQSGYVFNTLCIGAVQTEMLENAFPGYSAPLLPEDMAVFIYQFTTSNQRFIKGKTLPVSTSTP